MYIRNIITAMGELNDDEVLFVNFKSGKSSRIFKTDVLEKVNGDLKVIRDLERVGRCIVYIDSAEVESLIIKKDEMKDMVLK